MSGLGCEGLGFGGQAPGRWRRAAAAAPAPSLLPWPAPACMHAPVRGVCVGGCLVGGSVGVCCVYPPRHTHTCMHASMLACMHVRLHDPPRCLLTLLAAVHHLPATRASMLACMHVRLHSLGGANLPLQDSSDTQCRCAALHIYACKHACLHACPPAQAEAPEERQRGPVRA